VIVFTAEPFVTAEPIVAIFGELLSFTTVALILKIIIIVLKLKKTNVVALHEQEKSGGFI
jgi:hypothetical protein